VFKYRPGFVLFWLSLSILSSNPAERPPEYYLKIGHDRFFLQFVSGRFHSNLCIPSCLWLR
jgi:hypothetical protein